MGPAILTFIGSLLIVMVCQRDPGRDVKPMANRLRSVPASTAPSEVIAEIQLDACQKRTKARTYWSGFVPSSQRSAS